jgi:ankyrin repeat protein
VELLLKAGADASAKDRQGRTALAWAEQRGYKETADLLRQQGVQK